MLGTCSGGLRWLEMLRVIAKHYSASALQEWLDYAEAKQGGQERILARSPSVGGMPATGGSASCAAKWCSSHCPAADLKSPEGHQMMRQGSRSQRLLTRIHELVNCGERGHTVLPTVLRQL